MSSLSLAFILLSVACSVIAQGLLKYGMTNLAPSTNKTTLVFNTLFNPFVVAGLFFYLVSMVFWLYVLSKVELSRAYPFVALGFIGTAIVGFFLYQEPITTTKLIALLLIVSGVLVLSVSK